VATLWSEFGWDSAAKKNASRRYLGNIWENLDAGFASAAQPAAVLGVDLVGGPKVIAIAALNHEYDGGPMAAPFEPDQLF
jgi:hypothetical protein